MNDISQYSDDQLASLTGMPIASGASAPAAGSPNIYDAILGQESGNNSGAGTSVDGAQGPAQIIPATFERYAQEGESIDNPDDNRAVGKRIIDDLSTRYNGDPARIAVGYFSGTGNVAPAGSDTPYKQDIADGYGKRTSDYVSDVTGRLGAHAAPAEPDISKMSDADIAKMTGAPIANKELSQDDEAYYDRMNGLTGFVAHPLDTVMNKASDVAEDTFGGMYHGAGDLADLVTGNTGDAISAAKKAFNEKYQAGTATSADVKKLYLTGFSDNPGGKLLSASRMFPPIAAGSAIVNDVVNPALEAGASALGMDKEDVPLAEIPLMALGAKAGPKDMVPDFVSKRTASVASNVTGKVAATVADLTDTPISQSGVIPDTMSKTVEGQPLLISNSGAREGIDNFKKFRDQDLSEGGLNKVADTLEEMQKTNPDARAIDAMTKAEGDLPTGANITGLARSIANSPGQGRTMLAQMAGRGRQAANIIGGAFDKFVSTLPYSKVAADATAAKEASAPIYEEAYTNNPAINDPTVNAILQRPVGKAALAKASVQMMNDMRGMGPIGTEPEGLPTPPSEVDSYVQNAKELLARPAPKAPPSLTSFVQRNGGISDMQGELKQFGLDSKSRPAFISKNGSSADTMAERAWEDGYFPEHTSRPDVNEFLDALNADHNGYGPRYRDQDAGVLEELNARKNADEFLSQQPASKTGASAPEAEPQTHSLRKLNYVKIYLDEVGAKAAAKGDMNDASIYSDLANRMREALDNADATGGMYALARNTFSTGPRMEDAFNFGNKFETKRPEELDGFFNSKTVSDSEKGAALAGVRDRLQSIADRKNVGQNPISAMSKIALQKRLKIIGGDKSDEMITTLDNAAHMTKNDQLLAGSQTASNLAFQDSQAPAHTLPGRIVGEIPVVGGLIGYGIDKALAGRTAKMSTDAKAMISRILTSGSPAEIRALAHKMGEK